MKKFLVVLMVAALAATMSFAQTNISVPGTSSGSSGPSASAPASVSNSVMKTTAILETEGRATFYNKADSEAQMAGLPDGTNSLGSLHIEGMVINQLMFNSWGLYGKTLVTSDIKSNPFTTVQLGIGPVFLLGSSQEWWKRIVEFGPTISGQMSKFKAVDIGLDCYFRWDGFEASIYGNGALAPWGAKNNNVSSSGVYSDGSEDYKKWYVGSELRYGFDFGLVLGLKGEYLYTNDRFGPSLNKYSPRGDWSFEIGYRGPNEDTYTFVRAEFGTGGRVITDKSGTLVNGSDTTISAGIKLTL